MIHSFVLVLVSSLNFNELRILGYSAHAGYIGRVGHMPETTGLAGHGGTKHLLDDEVVKGVGLARRKRLAGL